MADHSFNFKGGRYLTTIGAAWFVCYLYYKHIDPTMTNWNKVKTYPNRRSVLFSKSDYHQYWLEQVTTMDETNLNKNTIGLSGCKIKEMAQELLSLPIQ